MRSTHSPRNTIGHGLGAACAVGMLLAASAQAQESYGFVRVVEGYVDLVQASSQSVVEVTSNYPILVGDQLRVSLGGRLETVLPDGSYVRVEGNTELKFARLAQSADTYDDSTLLQLLQGEIQVVLPDQARDVDEYRIDTANATVYLERGGAYRIFTDGDSWSEILVRSGVAEVVTERGSALVRTEEQAIVDGSRMPRVAIESAAARDSLEDWGDRLFAEARAPQQPRYVAPALSYAASPLYRHGSWVQVGGSTAWRPYVSLGWRPYHSGWWMHTPSGLTWVSTEPWGWVTYHYGVWDYAVGVGWVWYPGQVYSPAAVYWYWGPSYVGWIPAGYYCRFYRYPYPHHYGYSMSRHGYRYGYPGSGFGVHGGIHGWAGGHVSFWADWTFSSYEHLGYRDSHSHVRTGAQLTRRGAFEAGVPRGIITTNTRPITPELWHRPDRVRTALERSHGGNLTDLTSWVGRRPELAQEVRAAMAAPASASSLRTRNPEPNPSAPTVRPSPLGEAALSRPAAMSQRRLAEPSRSETITGSGTSRSLRSRTSAGVVAGQDAPRSPSGRQWDPQVWKRETRTRAQPTVPYRRDALTSAPAPSAAPRTPVSRRVWEGVRSLRTQGRATVGGGSLVRPAPSGDYRRPTSAAPSSRTPSRISAPGNPSSTGRVSAGGASRSSASSRSGGSGRPASRGGSGAGGSGSG